MPKGDIRISSNFSLSSQRPLDDRTVVIDDAERLALTLDRRYHLMRVDVAATNKAWQLVLGTVDQDLLNNDNWINESIDVKDDGVLLVDEIVSTVEYEGIPIGTTFTIADSVRTIMLALLAPYVSSKLNSLVITPNTTVEVGTEITIVSATIEWNEDSAEANPIAAVITGVGFGAVVLLNSPQVVNAIASSTVIKTTDTSESWVFSATDTEDKILDPITAKVYWQFRYLFGASATLIIDAATAQTVLSALQAKVLTEGKELVTICTEYNNNPSNYTYIAYAAKYGNLEKILQDDVLNVLTAFTDLGTYNYTNEQGHIESYRIYRSNVPGAFSSKVTLTTY